MEAALAFLLGVATSYWFLVAVVAMAIYAEYSDNHVTSACLTLIGLISGYLLFNLSPLLLLAYIPVGMVWSIWRWKVHCKDCSTKAIEGTLDPHSSVCWRDHSNPETRRHLAAHVDLAKNIDIILSWVICFPVSVIERLGHDLIHVLKIAITEWFAKVYNHSSNSALNEFDNNAPSSLDES